MKQKALSILVVFSCIFSSLNMVAQNAQTFDESIQLPIFRFVGWGERIPSVALKNVKEVSADLNHLNINTIYKVEKYTALVVHANNATITKVDCTGTAISDALKMAFQTVQPGDFVIVKDIYLSSENRASFKTQDAVFVLR